ncbi:MAG: bifunctional riboflavin kinase/FAD synthetase [Bacteroidota bacterium]|jgi:riboflavin kinase/FMN adenylyltransferase
MNVVHSENDILRETESIVTIGTFDGMHLGHRAIIDEVLSRAKTHQGRSVVLTFTPHPREVVGRVPVKYLSNLEERLDILATMGIDVTLVLKFTYEFSRLSSREFYQRYVVQRVGVRQVVVGHDHMFGKDREAGVRELQQIGWDLGFTAVTVPPVVVNDEVVSSTAIREHLLRGEVDLSERLLGRPYALQGFVVKGDGRGVELGFPTANIEMDYPNKLLPASGVYLVRADLGPKRLHGMLNIGVRPTFETDHRQTVEVHLFDFHDEIYGERLNVSFIKRLRDEKKFSSRNDLTAQLRQDQRECMKYLGQVYQL